MALSNLAYLSDVSDGTLLFAMDGLSMATKLVDVASDDWSDPSVNECRVTNPSVEK